MILSGAEFDGKRLTAPSSCCRNTLREVITFRSVEALVRSRKRSEYTATV